MTKLFVDKSIEIHASAQRVWDALTSRETTAEWASEFAVGGPQLHIESDWTVGSTVLWKDAKGHVVVEGTVTAARAPELLGFTVFDVRREESKVAPEDGITCKLTERDGKTVLWISQGDFSSITDGARYRDLTAPIWERALAKIKRVAEKAASASGPEDPAHG